MHRLKYTPVLSHDVRDVIEHCGETFRTQEVTSVTNTTTLLGRWGLRGIMVLASLAAAVPVQAGWQSPFELTCFRKKQTTYYVAAPVVAAPACCPQTVAQYTPPPTVCTQYVARTYYQPVTTYQQQCISEPHTELRTSYYYEPVTSYRYSYAYDPCNCSYQAIATPQTSYALRAQTTPVTTYVQKTQMVPVTQYRQMTYFEPQTTVTPAAPVVVPGPVVPGPVNGAPIVTSPPAGVQENRTPAVPPAGVQENRTPNSPLYNNPPANGTGLQQRTNVPAKTITPRPDRITSNDSGWRPVSATLAKNVIPE